MILYLDTSALVKLFVEENDRDLVISAVLASSEVCGSTIAYAEARATFARKLRDGALDSDSHMRSVRALDASWSLITRMGVTSPLAERAGTLAQEFGLRGYDAVHLATALRFDERYGGIVFLAFDHDLIHAATAAHLQVFSHEP